jgi:hypothetical protein
MAYNPVPTVATGDPWSAANANTYWRDNFAAGVPDIFTAAGDMAYATAANVAAVLAKPSVTSIFRMLATGVPDWLDVTKIPGVLHNHAQVNFAPAQTFAGGWEYITGATVTLTLGTQCSIFVRATVTGYNASGGRSFFVRSEVDGAADPSTSLPFNGGEARNEGLSYFYKVRTIPAGSRTVKLQCAADTDPNYVEKGHLEVMAFAE